MMRKYYAIYDVNRKGYFTTNPFSHSHFTDSSVMANWFHSKSEAKSFIESIKELRHKGSLCIKEVANFDD